MDGYGYQYFPFRHSSPYLNIHSLQMLSSSDSEWQDALEETSLSSSWTYALLSTPDASERYYRHLRDHHVPDRSQHNFEMHIANHGSALASEEYLSNHMNVNAELCDDQYLLLNPGFNSLVLDPGGSGVSAGFDHVIPDLMFPGADVQQSTKSADSLRADGPKSQRCSGEHFRTSSSGSNASFTQAQAQIQAPWTQPLSENANRRKEHERSSRLQSMSDVFKCAPSTLTESQQNARELVFDSVTGEEYKFADRKRHRTTSEEQRLQRNLIRNRGGQCDICKKSKKPVS